MPTSRRNILSYLGILLGISLIVDVILTSGRDSNYFWFITTVILLIPIAMFTHQTRKSVEKIRRGKFILWSATIIFIELPILALYALHAGEGGITYYFFGAFYLLYFILYIGYLLFLPRTSYLWKR